MALSRRRLKPAESLLSVALGMAAFASEDSAREIKRLAEKPLQDWADDDVAAVMTWIAQRGPKAADRRIEHQVDLVLTVIGNLPQSDPLWIEAQQFFEKSLSGERFDAVGTLERLASEAKKRLA